MLKNKILDDGKIFLHYILSFTEVSLIFISVAVTVFCVNGKL
jgi:hypothetical protein